MRTSKGVWGDTIGGRRAHSAQPDTYTYIYIWPQFYGSCGSPGVFMGLVLDPTIDRGVDHRPLPGATPAPQVGQPRFDVCFEPGRKALRSWTAPCASVECLIVLLFGGM